MPTLAPLARNCTEVTHPLESNAVAARKIFGFDRNEAPLLGASRLTLGGTLV